MVLELGRFGSHIRKTSKVVRCGAEEKWRISFRPIVSYMRNCQTQGEECPTYNKKIRKADCIGHILRKNCLLNYVTEGRTKGRVEVMGRRERRSKQLPEDV